MHEQHDVPGGRSRKPMGTSRRSQHHYDKAELTSLSLFLHMSFLDQSKAVTVNTMVLDSVIFLRF